jgi:hypothetical protein
MILDYKLCSGIIYIDFIILFKSIICIYISLINVFILNGDSKYSFKLSNKRRQTSVDDLHPSNVDSSNFLTFINGTGTHSERGKVIRCDIKPGSVERSIDL